MNCFFCGSKAEITDRIGRQDRCPHCSGDLHICRNCRFYDPSAYNECRETQAERVLDKEASNFCDFFSAVEDGAVLGGMDEAASAKKKLKEMFKK